MNAGLPSTRDSQTFATDGIRHARPEDREKLRELIDGAFGFALVDSLPHLFTDARIGDHIVSVEDGRLVAVVGLYPHTFHVGDIAFDVAGVGQVATAKDARGGGRMSSLLAETARLSDRFDFVWLGGDRQRYGRYGWSPGGARLRFKTFDKYLPPPPDPAAVLETPLCERVALVLNAYGRSPARIAFAPGEAEALLAGPRGRSYRVWELGAAFVVGTEVGDRVVLGDGREDELTALLSHLGARLRARGDRDRWALTVDCTPDMTPLLRVCQRLYWKVQAAPSESFRVGDLVSFCGKACRVAQARVAAGDGDLGLVNADTGQSVALRCRDGRLTVAAGVADASCHRLSTEDLTALCFGLCPPDILLPELPPASPFRQVFPLRIHISELFGL